MSILSRLKFEFTINTLFIGILFLIIGSGVTSYWLTVTNPYEAPTGSLPVPVQVGKNKVIVSKTGDASMRTEYNRRRTIISSNSGPNKKFGFGDSTNGSLETFFLSSIITSLPKAAKICSVLYDGGDANTEACKILDGGDAFGTQQEIEIDLGDAYTTTVCFI